MKPTSQVPETQERSYRVESLARGLAVLSLFSREAPQLTLSEISAKTGLSKSTAFRITRTLEESGYLVRLSEGARFQPGLKVLELGFSLLAGMSFRDIARPFLEEVARETGETVSLSLLDGLSVVYVDRIRNRSIVGVVLELGSRIPAHCASMGKAMLAHLPSDELTELLDGAPLAACTRHSVTDRNALLHELAEIRKRGFALNDQELEIGLRAVAAPIRGRDGRVVAAINATGSVRTISKKRLVKELAPQVLAAAQKISRALGASS